MKQPKTMFEIKPLLTHDVAVELPNCMYKIKNLHGPRNNNIDGRVDHVVLNTENLDIIDKNHQEIAGMAELELRQDEILKQLEQLKQQIHLLKSNLNNQSTANVHKVPSSTLKQCSQAKVNLPLPEYIVINANATNPPYCLQLIQRLCQNQVALKITSYLHSSVSALSNSVQLLQHSLDNFKSNTTNVPVLHIKLIWKNIDSNIEFILGQTLVTGEANFLRYLARLLRNSPLSYESYDNTKSFEIDSILDQCYLLVRSKTKTQRTSILQLLSKSLGKADWLMGKTTPGLIDVASYSAIKQSASQSELFVNLRYWYSRCRLLIES